VFALEEQGTAEAGSDANATLPLDVLRRAVLSARSRSGGERMRTSDAPGAPTRTLKNLFQERGIPAWKRDVPLLYIGDELLFVPWLGVNRAALPASADTGGARIRIIWREDLLIA
jgi:tRNA(Ile)-lysidine synthase